MSDYEQLESLKQQILDIVSSAKTAGALIFKIGELPEIHDYILYGFDGKKNEEKM